MTKLKMNATLQQLKSEHWIAFLEATKGSRIHRILDGVLCGFLVVGIFAGGFVGFFLSQHFESNTPFWWELGFLLLGLYSSLYGFIFFRCRILDSAFCRYLANLESTSQRESK